MPTNIFVSLPHEHDGIVNYALSLLRDATNPAADKILCHADTNGTPLQRHARNLLHGRDSRNDRVTNVNSWIEQVRSESPHLHIYGRFFIADYEMPVSPVRTENFLQLVWLYFRDLDPRINFVDYGEALGGSRYHCAHILRENVLQRGDDEARAAKCVTEYLEDWTFSLEGMLARATALFGKRQVRVINFDDFGKAGDVFLELRDTICDGRASAEVFERMDKQAVEKAIGTLERRMSEVLRAEFEKTLPEPEASKPAMQLS